MTEHARMRIVSDGTGQGTCVYVDDKVLDDVHSLQIIIPNRQSTAHVTMTIKADISMFAVVAPGEVSLLHAGEKKS